MADKKDIEKIVAKMSAAFPNWKINAFTIQVYLEDLGDIDGETLIRATDMCRTQPGRAFAPSTGEIRGAVSDIRRSINNIPSSYEAWGEVCAYWQGHRETKHPLIEKTVECLGGWHTLGMSTDQTADRARFIMAYEQLEDRAMKEGMLLPEVRGYIESQGGKMLEAPMDAIKRLAEGKRVA